MTTIVVVAAEELFIATYKRINPVIRCIKLCARSVMNMLFSPINPLGMNPKIPINKKTIPKTSAVVFAMFFEIRLLIFDLLIT